VVAVMKEVSETTVKTFTIGFDDPAYDEAPYAKEVAAHLRTDHHEQYLSPRDFFEVIPALPDMFDEPFGDSSQIPTFLVSQVARKHVTVSLSGDGGDELFGGYNHYRWGPRVAAAASLLPRSLSSHVAKHLRGIFANRIPQRADRLLGLLSAPSGSIETLIASVFPDPYGALGCKHPVSTPDMSAFKGGTVAERLMMSDLVDFLPDDILVKLDRASMSVALESRAPFLDHGIAGWAWSLPLAMRTTPKEGKPVLRQLLSRYVPRTLFDRPKQGFGLPLDRWFRQELRPLCEKYLLAGSANYGDLLSPAKVALIWNQHASGKFNRQREIWVLLSLVMWLERFA
jgi:asparagine synthase (glutamine-hydrolysing)